ncbi:MAG: bifunctional [glutamate--ammonia ligase]-adenylyl-L-tyrosine phosphorylase/[glutamate--ammonia-ligase] adenylyltransferase [Polyangiaceae bacterium]|nr:bifunctional [glutamate--ammonia ligase]-adenylyl-L-tyrosine phosphorylase/[glutamate--ammonia-ligase] adenylyltransferase [Polyangiaceae bacterium]
MSDESADRETALAIATLLVTVYPSLATTILSEPDIVYTIVHDGFHTQLDRAAFVHRVLARVGDVSTNDHVARDLRKAVRAEKVRIALREALPLSLGGADVDVTAHEHACLAEAAIEVALGEALSTMSNRYGKPMTGAGTPSRFVVLGMGKLGGEELNAGSDIDLVYLYDSDDGACVAGPDEGTSLFDFWTRVARRLTATLDDVTEDGFVFRVDLRLRPEGRSGPLVNSLAAAERYYESFGRLWERAALLRARPVAGSRAFGEEALAALTPFVFRRRVDPKVAVEMVGLVERSRATLKHDPARDLKLGPGGIREAEFFVQTLMLVWGGQEPRARAKGTLDAVRRLRALGLVTHREAREIIDGYLLLRRAEHLVQTRTGLQTHVLPEAADELDVMARILGFLDGTTFQARLGVHTRRIAELFRSLLPSEAPPPSRWLDAIAALERSDAAGFADALVRAALKNVPDPSQTDLRERWIDVARDLFELSKRPDRPLGALGREAYPDLVDTLLDAVLDSVDPEQAARYLRMFFSRLKVPGVYAKFLGDDPRAARRLVEVLGASAFVGEAVTQNLELGDTALFSRGAPTLTEIREQVFSAIRAGRDESAQTRATDSGLSDSDERFVTALRRTKARIVIEVGLADLAGEISVREATAALSALADACLEVSVHQALDLGPDAQIQGLSVIAMGKLGGREIGYGSDLDVIFVFDPAAAPKGVDADVYFTRSARKVIRFVSMSHHAGAGYELDTRLRPSGNQGLLVTSIDSFARYHHARTSDNPEGTPVQPSVRAAAWERLALLRARFSAGDQSLGERAISVAHAATYELAADPEETRREIGRLRERMLRELANERRGRYDPKLGRGGLIEIELTSQLLQMTNGHDHRVRTTDTSEAIEALFEAGYLSVEHASALREGYTFLRRLQERSRIVHAAASQYLEENAPGLLPLARRMGIRDRTGTMAAGELIARYRTITDRVRAAYDAIVAGGGSA